MKTESDLETLLENLGQQYENYIKLNELTHLAQLHEEEALPVVGEDELDDVDITIPGEAAAPAGVMLGLPKVGVPEQLPAATAGACGCD